jgi:peptidoglycan/xylan/chitin deacetylase (PgdA/CDA1 family)
MKLDNKLKIADAVFSWADRFRVFDIYSLSKKNIRSQVNIIMYHRVGTNKEIWSVDAIDKPNFEKQMKYLIKTHQILSLEKLAQNLIEKKPLPKRTAVVTFDDGYKDNYKNAYPILKKYNIPATIFLTTGHINTDKLFWWDHLGYILLNTKLKQIHLENFGIILPPLLRNNKEAFDVIMERFNSIPEDKKCELIKKLENISDVDIPKEIRKDKTLSWNEVKKMNENKIDFGAHTVNHSILTKISLIQAEYEILQSKKDIEKRLNKPVTTFCYPNGLADDFNSEIIDLLKKNGFICAVTRIPKTITLKTNLYELGRIPPGWSYDSFKFCTSGIYSDLSNILS